MSRLGIQSARIVPHSWRSEAKCRPGPANKVRPFPHLKFTYNNLKRIKVNFNSVNTENGALLRSGKHLDKIGEIGLKLAFVKKRWLAPFTMICKLDLVQWPAEFLWCPGTEATAWLYAPCKMLILRNVKIQVSLQQNYLPQPFPHAKALRHKSFTSGENKEAKKLSESRTKSRNNNKTLERCENNFVWHFWREKGKYVSDAGALLKRTWCILKVTVLPWRWSVLTAPNDVHSDKFSELFLSFLQQLKAKNLFLIANFAIGFSWTSRTGSS